MKLPFRISSSRRTRRSMIAIASAAVLVLATSAVTFAASQHDSRVAPPGTNLSGSAAQVVGTAVVNFEALAKLDAEHLAVQPPYIPRIMPKAHEPAEPDVVIGLAEIPPARVSPAVASPSPSTSFEGLDDIPIGGTGFITIPPDVDGAVGRTRVMTGLNNNYRIFDKSTGAVLSTTSTNTFWAGSGGTINTHFDPKTIYDPINDRWIVVMMCDGGTANSSVQVGVSQTSDPAGAYYIFRVDTDAGNTLWADFPSIGFNKNWVAIGMNMFTISAGAFSTGKMLVIDYPSLRAGAFVATMFTGTGFCSSPAATYSSTENTLYTPTHLSSGGGTFRVDLITGTPAAPVYTIGATKSRGLTWTQTGGNILPQAAPLAGASACGATPCKIDCIDSQIRSTPVFRNGSIYYTQTVGATSLTRTMLQWTKIDAVTGVVQDGGRIEDPTATATNGGKWYAYGHIAVNAAGDIIVGYSQFASNQYGASAYSMHLAADAPGTMRDPYIFRAGDDYYHKTFNLTTSRNRWGDYSKAQVDPADDQSLWVVDEWAKLRTGTDDGNTGSNSSKWGTWWANVAGPAPTVTIAPGPSNPEGNAGTTAFDFTVNLSTGYSLPVTVNYQTSDGTATTGNNDYASVSGSIVIPAGFTSGTITVNGNGDATLEGDETFSVSLTGATNATVGLPSSSTGTIQNDDGQPTIDIEMAALSLEGNAGPATVNLAVTLSNASDQPVTVDWQTNDGSATLANNDYVQDSGTLTFPAKTTGPQTVTVTINGDATQESDETFTVTLSNPVGGTIGNGTGTVTIQNDDGTPTVDIEMVELSLEGNAGPSVVSLDVTLSHASDQPVTVDWQTNDGTATLANNDYDQGSGTLTFPPKTTGPQTITVTVNGDGTLESDETLTVTLSNASGATIGNGTGTVTIQNDDGTPTVGIEMAELSLEGNAGPTLVNLDVTLSHASDQPVTVDWQTNDGSATLANNDYQQGSGTLTFPPKTTGPQTVTVTVNGDGTLESDETLTVTLSNASGATIGNGTGTLTIQNDDGTPTVGIEMAELSLEGNAGPTLVNLDVTLSHASDQPVTVDWQTNDGSATLANNDYQQGSGTLTFPPKTTGPQTITVTVNGDGTLESDETLTVTLSNASGATIGKGTGTLTIQNDDGTPTVDIEMAELSLEGNAGPSVVSLDVTLSHASDQPVTVDWQTNDGSALLANNDYLQGSGTVTFPAKTTGPQTVTVTINGDATLESDETFTVTLSNPVGATIGNGTGTVTIQNDDGAPSISISDVALAEGKAGFQNFNFTVSLSNASDTPITVDYQTADGSATAPSDYAALALTTLTIPAKTTQATITVQVQGDVDVEGDENFFVNLSSPTGATLADNQGEGTIIEDEVTAVLLSMFDVQSVDAGVSVRWQFTDASDVTATWLERASSITGPWARIEAVVTIVNGVTSAIDRSAEPGRTYGYRLIAQVAGGRTVKFPPAEVTAGAAVTEYMIANVVPNPTSGQASVDYTVPRAGKVRLGIVDLQGRSVAVLADGISQPGRHRAMWNGKGPRGPVAMGVYFVRYEAGGRVMVKRLMMTR